MSTRCNIIIKKFTNEVVLYHHYDGYPRGVGIDLVRMFEDDFKKSSKIYIDDVVNKLIKNEDDKGYEWTTGLHGDIEYLYTIDCDAKTITCEDADNWGTELKVWNKRDMFDYAGKVERGEV